MGSRSQPIMAEMTPPGQEEMNEMDYEQWTAEQVADYFSSKGYEEYRNIFIDNELSGDRVVLITQEDIPDLNIPYVGDRVGFMKTLRNLKTQARLQLRKVEIDHAEQAFDGCWINEMLYTCFGLCPRDPDQYILKAGKLQIKQFEWTRICGTWKCICLGGAWHNDNISLDKIKDVDTVVTKSGCLCCRVDKAKILIAVAAGADADGEEARVSQKELFVEGDIGTAFADKILLQSEEYILQLRGIS